MDVHDAIFARRASASESLAFGRIFLKISAIAFLSSLVIARLFFACHTGLRTLLWRGEGLYREQEEEPFLYLST